MKRFHIYMILTFALCLLIFFFSSQPGEASSEVSGGLTESIVKALQYISIDLRETERIYGVERVVRKMAHLSIYFALGICSALSVDEYWSQSRGSLAHKQKNWFFWIVPFVFCVLYAASDELHQLFVPGRTGSIRDVLLFDSVGAGLGVLAMRLILRIVRNRT